MVIINSNLDVARYIHNRLAVEDTYTTEAMIYHGIATLGRSLRAWWVRCRKATVSPRGSVLDSKSMQVQLEEKAAFRAEIAAREVALSIHHRRVEAERLELDGHVMDDRRSQEGGGRRTREREREERESDVESEIMALETRLAFGSRGRPLLLSEGELFGLEGGRLSSFCVHIW